MPQTPLPRSRDSPELLTYSFGPFVLNGVERRLLRNGVTVLVSPKVLETLLALVERSGDVVSKAELIERVWPGVFVEEGNLTQNISQLRRIFNHDFPPPGAILTLSKRGYSFIAPVHAREIAARANPSSNILQARERDGIFPENSSKILSPDASKPESPKGIAPSHVGAAVQVKARSSFRWSRMGVLISLALAGGIAWRLRTTIRQNGVYASRPSVAILGFENLSGRPDADWLSTALTENLQADLSASEGVEVVPGEVVSRVERELSISKTASLSRESLDRIHRDLGCELVMSGSYLIAGGRIRLNLVVEDASKGTVLGTYTSTEDQDDVLPLIADAGAKIRNVLRLKELSPQSSNEVVAAIEKNPDALKLYQEGLDKIRVEDGDSARAFIEQAINLNPKFPLAHFALSQAWSLSGYELRANTEAKRAVDLSGQLSRENQLRLQARFYETQPDWNKAAESYHALRLFFPNDKDYGYRLAEALIASGRPDEALMLLKTMESARRKGSDPDPRALLLEADAFAAKSQWIEALTASQQGAATAKANGALILHERTLASEAVYLSRLGRVSEEEHAIDEAFAEAQQVGDRLSPMILRLRQSQGMRRARELEAAGNVARQALAMSQVLGARRWTMECYTTLGLISRDGNDLHAAKSFFEQGLALARELGSTGTATLKLNLANVENNLGEPDKARALYMDALKSAEQVGDRGTQNILHGNLGILDASEGNPVEGIRMLRLAIAGNRAISQNGSIAYDLGHVAEILMTEGDFAGARQALDEQLTVLPALGRGRGPDEQRLSRARLVMDEGRLDQAQPEIEASVAACKDAGSCFAANRLLALVWLTRGDAQRALPFAEKSYGLGHTFSNPADYILPADLRMAEVDAALGRVAAAHALFTSTAQQARQLKLLPLELDARIGLARMRFAVAPVQARAELIQIRNDATARKLQMVANRADKALEQLGRYGT
jgi:eukaryotic-like serine/threonine-protein kinase